MTRRVLPETYDGSDFQTGFAKGAKFDGHISEPRFLFCFFGEFLDWEMGNRSIEKGR